jgi:hypothetical protein
VAERLNAAALKAVRRRKASRGFESHPLRYCHRYLEGEKQPAEPLPFEVSDTNDAMAKIIDWFAENWTELIS